MWASRTGSGAASPRPSANCCSSATSAGLAASAAALSQSVRRRCRASRPAEKPDTSVQAGTGGSLEDRPVLLVLLDLVPVDPGVQQDLLRVLAVFGSARRLDVLSVELHRVGRQQVWLLVHRLHPGG